GKELAVGTDRKPLERALGGKRPERPGRLDVPVLNRPLVDVAGGELPAIGRPGDARDAAARGQRLTDLTAERVVRPDSDHAVIITGGREPVARRTPRDSVGAVRNARQEPAMRCVPDLHAVADARTDAVPARVPADAPGFALQL